MKKIIVMGILTMLITNIMACGITRQDSFQDNTESSASSVEPIEVSEIEFEEATLEENTEHSESLETIELEEVQIPEERIEENEMKYWNLIKDDKNSNFSPISLEYAMLMLQAGANERESQKIGNVLGEADITKAIEVAGESMKRFEEDGVVNIANAVFVDKTFELKDTYQLLLNPINADAITTNFSTSKGQEDINVWVSDKTNGLIKAMPVNEATRAAILNAIYFKDSWDLFDEKSTFNETFYGRNCEVEAKIMNGKVENETIFSGETYTSLTLYMENSEMTIYLPNEDCTFEDVITEIESGTSPSSKTYSKIYIKMPKFKFETTTPLNQFIADSGLGEIFSGDDNMFSNMSDEPLHIDTILQKATIDVSESGVEASAATMITMRNMVSIDKAPSTSFNVIRPFLYKITSNGETLFIGGVTDVEAVSEDDIGNPMDNN